MSAMSWTRGPVIGHGSSAIVSLANFIPSGELLAVKSNELSKFPCLQREQQLLSNLCSPHVIKCMGFDVTVENNVTLYNLFLEYISGGNLYEEIQDNGGCLGESVIRSYTKQILQGLAYLHEKKIVHCDIKSHNILIGKGGVKIGDLGCARSEEDEPGKQNFDSLPFSGTPAFMAPEVARGEDQSFPADIWALGCTIIEMATGSSPWPKETDPMLVLYRIGYSDEIPDTPCCFSDKAKDFLYKCLRRDSKERWTASELLEHPFLEELGSNSADLKQLTLSSPSSVLLNGMWDSVQELHSPKNSIDKGCRRQSSAFERINELVGNTFSSVQVEPDWTWNGDWVTVRSQIIKDGEKRFEQNEAAVVDDRLSELTANCSIESLSADDEEFPFPFSLPLLHDDLLFEDTLSVISATMDIELDRTYRNFMFDGDSQIDNNLFLSSILFVKAKLVIEAKDNGTNLDHRLLQIGMLRRLCFTFE